MGSYAECWLDDLYVGSTKNDFDYGLMQLFRASDKHVEKCAVKDVPRAMRWSRDSYDDPNEVLSVVYYSAPVSVVRDRLDLKGYTLDAAKRVFRKRIKVQEHFYSEPSQGMEEYYDSRARILKSLTVEDWLTTLQKIKNAGLANPLKGHTPYEKIATLEHYMLEEDWYGFSGVDSIVPLRLALEICDEGAQFIYDLTDVVSSGYLKRNDDCVALASEFSTGEHLSRSRIIVLTEGRSDGWILSESMKVLYPHLYDYFGFMDFETAKVEGGTSPLVKIVKSFAGAGIMNKVIAIFDNDTAGHEAVRSLRQIKLPGHLRVLTLPDLRLLRKYPTIGPSGRKAMNVNGTAASIELYLGEDVLREDGKLMPVKWTGFNQVMKRYQGEVLAKDKIQKRFADKLEREKASNDHPRNDWSAIRSILSTIFSAFHRFDERLILSEHLERYERY